MAHQCVSLFTPLSPSSSLNMRAHKVFVHTLATIHLAITEHMLGHAHIWTIPLSRYTPILAPMPAYPFSIDGSVQNYAFEKF
jgi:hypothetical protein